MTSHSDVVDRTEPTRGPTRRSGHRPSAAIAADADPIDFDQLQAALRAADPNVLLAAPWLLQAVIAHVQGLMPTGLQVPDDQLCAVGRAAFLAYVEDRELPLPAGDLPPGPDLILLERPDPEWLATTPGPEVLARYWRLLARATAEARVRRALPDPRAGASADAVRAAVDARVARVGRAAFDEARQVLTRDRRLGSAATDLDAYAKFAAAIVDLWRFAPQVLGHVFPSVRDPAAVAAAVEADVGAGLAESVRPPGAPDPPADEGLQQMEPPAARRTWWALVRRWLWPRMPGRPAAAPTVRRPDKGERAALLAAAARAADRRNDVRSAVLTAHAHRSASDDWRVAPGLAARELDRLADRLAAALEFAPAEAADWRAALRGLLGPAAVGWKSPESRLLYDLQKVCDDREREVYSVHVVEWALELGRRPLFRPLPNQRLAQAGRHLQAAVDRLPKCRQTAVQRARLDRLLHDALHDADHRLRHALTPSIASAFAAAGLVPRSAAEAVARDKMFQELLDVVLRDGFLTFAGVRDAVASNALRCKDLTRPAEWVGYDQLMRLDRCLGDALDGVYRRGEAYRYLFQKGSSWLFAWPVGRLLTKAVVLPLTAAYILLAAVDHMVVEKLWPHQIHLTDWEYRLPTAFVLALLVNWPTLRHAAGRAVAVGFRALAFVLFELPERLLRNPLVVTLVNSRPLRMTVRYGVKPLPLMLLAWWLVPAEADSATHGLTCGLVFLATNLAINSRAGRAIEQAVLHGLRVGWVRFTSDVVTHALQGVVRLFARMVEAVDRMLYAVDEWLRYRQGQPKQSLVGKAALGVVWFYIAYVTRFALNLLVEPQINPIKHFPVVTVSHKLLLPLALPRHGAPSQLGEIGVRLAGMSHQSADTTAAIVVWGIPGIFGFLAWELRSNWKLYRATLPATLRPVQFGSHGESVAQLLRPGFHSGTLPKAYARVRRAHRNRDPALPSADPTEHPLSVRKHLKAVHHVEEAVEKFVDRAFLPLVNGHPLFRATPVALAGVELGVSRIGLSLACPAVGPDPMRVEFQQTYGWIVADVPAAGWSGTLTGRAAEVLAFALRGLFKMAAVDVVRADVDAALAGRAAAWELRPKHLLVRPRPAGRTGGPVVRTAAARPTDDSAAAANGGAPTERAPADVAPTEVAPSDAEPANPPVAGEVEYALYEREMWPRPRDGGAVDPALPVLRPEQILFAERPILWADWVATWEENGMDGPPNDDPADEH